MIEINNFTKEKINKKFFKKVIEFVLKKEGKDKKGLSLAFVGALRIKKLNKKYLKRNYPTDVLSFPEQEWGLGEIVICPFKVKKNAKKFNSSFKKELARVLIHGILHLLGYDHERSKKEAEKMRKKEEYYLSQIIKFKDKI